MTICYIYREREREKGNGNKDTGEKRQQNDVVSIVVVCINGAHTVKDKTTSETMVTHVCKYTPRGGERQAYIIRLVNNIKY